MTMATISALPDCAMSWWTDWNVRNVKLKCLKYWIEIPTQDWNGARWNVWRCGTSYWHIGPFRAITICITIVAAIKSADWPDHACQYQYWWILIAVCGSRQKLLKSCGGTFQTCRYKNHLHLFHPVLARKFLSLDTDIDNQIDAANGVW